MTALVWPAAPTPNLKPRSDGTVAQLLVFRANDDGSEEARWGDVELFGALLTDLFPLLRVGLHLFGFDHESFGRKILGDARVEPLALPAPRRHCLFGLLDFRLRHLQCLLQFAQFFESEFELGSGAPHGCRAQAGL